MNALLSVENLYRNQRLGRVAETMEPVMMDVGARGGLDDALLPIAWTTTGFGFEPEPDACRALNDAPAMPWRSVSYFPVAVGGKTSSGTLHIPPNAEGASLLPHNHQLVDRFGHAGLHGPGRAIEVEIVTLDAAIKLYEVPNIDYLKLDVEGAELAVLQGGNEMVANCLAIKVECSFLEQRIHQPLVWDVVYYLRQRGFEVVDISDIHRWRRRPLPAHPYVARHVMPYSKGICAQCDVILLRDPASLSNHVLLSRLSVIAAVFGFFDQAFTIAKGSRQASVLLDEWVGADYQRALFDASRVMGRRVSRKVLISQLRGLIPTVRSHWGGIPVRCDREY